MTASETPQLYGVAALNYVDIYSTSAFDAISSINANFSAAVVLGAIAEEANDHLETWYEASLQAIVEAGADAYLNDHATILSGYQHLSSLSPEERAAIKDGAKLFNPVMIDFGIGNIQLYTAISLLKSYEQRYPNSDPLGLKQYSSDYSKLVDDLMFRGAATGVKFATLVVERGLEWGAQNVENWSSLSQAQREAFVVYFYNVGEDGVELKKAEKIAATGHYTVDIANTDIAQEYLLNRSAIIATMTEGDPRFDEFRKMIADDYFLQKECFLAGTPVLLADGTEKPIEEIAPGDWVMSYDAAGNLVPGRVSRTFQKDAKHILDFFGLMVTPGHVMLCGAGRYSGRHVTLLDILRSDGAVVRADGGLIRAATGVPVGSELDAEIEVVTGTAGPQGFVVRAAGRLRMGTRVILENGADLSLAELIAANGGRRTEAGLIASAAGEGPFVWPFGPSLPQPEDYVLSRSAVTLAEIYAAVEWETAPVLPGPVRGDLGPVGAAPAARRDKMPANLPLSMQAPGRTGLQ